MQGVNATFGVFGNEVWTELTPVNNDTIEIMWCTWLCEYDVSLSPR